MATDPETPDLRPDARRSLADLARAHPEIARRVIGRLTAKNPSARVVSYAQQRLWFLERLVPGSPFYNVPFAVRVAAAIDPDLLRATFTTIVQRHEALRTSFGEHNGKPTATAVESAPVPVQIIDLRGLSPLEQGREVVRAVELDARTPFDLRAVPLLRVGLILLGPADCVVVVCMHHIVSDGWSVHVLTEEIFAIYAALARGEGCPLPPLEVQYGDYAARQRREVESGLIQDQLQYWTDRLTNLPELHLPTDFPHRAVQGFEGKTIYFRLDEQLTRQLRELSAGRGVTLFMTLLAGFNALLHRYSGQDDIVVGGPVANRNRRELETLIGFFVNSQVLRTDVSGDPTLTDLLLRCREVVLGALEHADVPFDWLVETLRPERSMGKNPLFQVSLHYFSGVRATGRGRLPVGESIHAERGTSSLDLALDIRDDGSGLLCQAEFSTELFTAQTVTRMMGHLETILRAIVTSPDMPISRIPLLSPEDRHRAIQQWGRGGGVHRAAATPDELFVHVATQRPSAPAVASPNGRLTYAELHGVVDRVAEVLRARGLGPGSPIGVCADRSTELVIAALAIWRIGATYVPLDPSLPLARLKQMAEQVKPEMILVPFATEPLARQMSPSVYVVTLAEDDEFGLRPGAKLGHAFPRPSGDDPAYIIFTSGSTGAPKGVVVGYGSLCRHLAWFMAEFPLSPDDVGVFKYAPAFDVAIIEWLQPLLSGSLLLIPDAEAARDPVRLARLIRDRGVTVLDTVPSLLSALLDVPAFGAAVSLRRVLCGGDVMPRDLLDRLLSKLDVEFANMYGPTEATITATFWRPGADPLPATIPIGRPVGDACAYVLDRHLNPQPLLVPGQLYLGGGCLALGYLNDPDRTAAAIVPDPHASTLGGRLYATGDRARMLADGTLEFLGRMDDQVKIRGHRIELAEVETVLAGHPAVRSCAAALAPGPASEPELVAHVVPAPQEIELWPSVGEYFLYDDLLYHAMTSDQVRTSAYRRAIERLVRGRVVVDIGSGADLVLARMCMDAGARRVYAIEMLESAVMRARALCDEQRLGDRLTIIHGDSRAVHPPELADVCISELIGTIGSSEGAIDLLNDARRFLKPGGRMLPERCVTRIAAVSLPPSLLESPAFGPLQAHYAQRVFHVVGQPFDLRVCLKGITATALHSDVGNFEVLDFGREISREGVERCRLTIHKPGRIDGFLLWIALSVDGAEHIDVLASDTSWLPVFFPAFSGGVRVEPGDVIDLDCRRLATTGITPDYELRGELRRTADVKAPPAAFLFASPRNGATVGSSEFHSKLLRGSGRLPGQTPENNRDAERVEAWAQLCDRLYAGAVPSSGVPALGSSSLPALAQGARPAADNPALDTTGWNSTYTGVPFSPDEMLEQVNAAVDRILQLGAGRILEIGCGTGLLLLRLARHAEACVGTDFSPAVLRTLKARCEQLRLHNVQLLERHADDFAGVPDRGFDVIVLNSVIQYFPSADYLVRVLDKCVAVLRPGGSLFIGDVRSLVHQDWFHAGVELARAHHDTTLPLIRDGARRRAERDHELALDPRFFADWAWASHGLHAELQLKRGHAVNELTKFRYDVAIRSVPATAACDSRPWAKIDRASASGGPTAASTAHPVDALAALLERERPDELHVLRVPNARLGAERRLADLFRDPDSSALTARQLKEALRLTPPGVHPEGMWSLGDRLGYDVAVSFSQSAWGACDARFARRASKTESRSAGSNLHWGMPLSPTDPPLPWSVYASGAAASPPSVDHAEIESALRTHLRARVPAAMVPARFVFTNRLPLTAAGKVDRRALLQLERARKLDLARYEPPVGDTETTIAELWSRILGVERPSAIASFFDLGGHSLLATQVVSRLGAALGREVPLRLMFERPTIRSLGQVLDSHAAHVPATTPIIAPAIDGLFLGRTRAANGVHAVLSDTPVHGSHMHTMQHPSDGPKAPA